jgi:ketosteroid isomerase-like protein
VHGDMAYELGVERGEFKMAGHPVSLEHRVTNIYRREAGTWKLVHHHTDTSPGMLDVLKRLQSPAT